MIFGMITSLVNGGKQLANERRYNDQQFMLGNKRLDIQREGQQMQFGFLNNFIGKMFGGSGQGGFMQGMLSMGGAGSGATDQLMKSLAGNAMKTCVGCKF